MAEGIGEVFVRVGAKLAPNAEAEIKNSIVPAAEKTGVEAGEKISEGIKKSLGNAKRSLDPLRDSQAALTKAQADYLTAVEKSGKGSDAAAQAAERLQSANQKLKGQQQAVKDVLGQTTDNADRAAKSTNSWTDALKKAITVAAAYGAGRAVVQFFKDSITEARESEAVMRQTEAAIKSTGGAAKVTAAQIGDLATSLSNKTAMDDEAIQSAENLLLTFTNIRNEAGQGNDIFNQATKTVLDLSTAMGMDLNSSALMLGKALNDPIAGMTALGRAGVQLTQAQKDSIKSMVEMGDTLGAQKLLLAEVAKQVGGSAEALATPAEKAKVAWGNFKEQVGTALIPIIDKLANVAMDKVLPAFEKAIPAVVSFFDSFGSIAGAALPVVAELLGVVAAAVSQLIDAMPGGAATVAAFIGVWAGFNKLGGASNLFKEMGQRVAGLSIQMGGSYESANKAADGFAKFGKAVGIAGIAIGIGAGLFTLIDNATKMSAQNIAAASEAYQGFATQIQQGGTAALAGAAGIQAMNAQVTAFRNEGGMLAVVANDMEAGMKKGAAAAAAQQAAMGPLQQTQQALTKAQNDYQLALDKYGASSPQATAAAQNLAAANQASAAAQQQVTEATKSSTQALQEYMNQQLAAVNADVAASNAAIAVNAAQTEYNKSLNDGTLSADQKTSAENSLVTAVTASAAAAAQKAVKEAEAAGVTDTATAANEATLASLQAYAAQAGSATPAAIQQLIAKMQAQAANANTATGATNTTAAATANAGAQAQDAAGKVGNLGSQIKGLPASTSPKVNVEGNYATAKGEIQSLGQAIGALFSKSVTIQTVHESIYKADYVGGASKGAGLPSLASGGPVYGPGPKGKDSVFAMIAPGEHMWTSSEVDALGGHGAMLALRAAVRNGWRLPGYAQGGGPGVLPSRSQPMVINGPQTLTIVDTDGVLLGTMRVAASSVVASYDAATSYSASNRLEP